MCAAIDDSSEDTIWSSLGLEIQGKSCYIHDDAAAALHLDTEAHLIHWQDKSSLTMDRFDCRLLLDSYADVTMGTRSYDVNADEDEEECNKLRWRGVEFDADGCDRNALSDDSEVAADAADHDVAPDEIPSALQGSTVSPATYTLPHFTAACAHRPLLRVTHIIISRTARLVAVCGARIDTMLRIRHGALPCLQFLYSDHNLRPYFDAMTEVTLCLLRVCLLCDRLAPRASWCIKSCKWPQYSYHCQHYTRCPSWQDPNDTNGSDCQWAKYLLKLERDDACSSAAQAAAANLQTPKGPDFANLLVRPYILQHFLFASLRPDSKPRARRQCLHSPSLSRVKPRFHTYFACANTGRRVIAALGSSGCPR